jgi:hypothetical protein
MWKYILFFAVLSGLLITSCQQTGDNNAILQARVDSLQHQLDNAYKPGLGEFMSGIQVDFEVLYRPARSRIPSYDPATRHEFNVIRVPETPPFTNQVFEKPR